MTYVSASADGYIIGHSLTVPRTGWSYAPRHISDCSITTLLDLSHIYEAHPRASVTRSLVTLPSRYPLFVLSTLPKS
eukprot:scaffold563650_cov20-Prasinocladus_malaysianus.AAC.1